MRNYRRISNLNQIAKKNPLFKLEALYIGAIIIILCGAGLVKLDPESQCVSLNILSIQNHASIITLKESILKVNKAIYQTLGIHTGFCLWWVGRGGGNLWSYKKRSDKEGTSHS